MTIPRPVALALAGLVLTASLTACGSGSRQSDQDRYNEEQMYQYEQQHIQNQIKQREADIQRAVRDELNRRDALKRLP